MIAPGISATSSDLMHCESAGLTGCQLSVFAQGSLINIGVENSDALYVGGVDTDSEGSNDSGDLPNTPSNQSPVAESDSVTTTADTTILIDILANDSDADGDVLSITILS